MNDIVENLKAKGSFYKFNGIVKCVQSKVANADVFDLLKKLKDDNSQIAGFKISQYAIAALDILGVEKFNGDDEDVLYLIESNFVF